MALIALPLIATISYARSRGEPNTTERKAYCDERYLKCINSGADRCSDNYPNDARTYNACVKSAAAVCTDQFGDGSSCVSEPLIRKKNTRKTVAPKTPKAKLN